jgi:hypothetical protein
VTIFFAGIAGGVHRVLFVIDFLSEKVTNCALPTDQLLIVVERGGSAGHYIDHLGSTRKLEVPADTATCFYNADQRTISIVLVNRVTCEKTQRRVGRIHRDGRSRALTVI